MSLQGQQLGPEAAGSGLLHIAVQPAHAPTEEAAKRARSMLAGMQVLPDRISSACAIGSTGPGLPAHAARACAGATGLPPVTHRNCQRGFTAGPGHWLAAA